ncbi:MAG: mannose-1-phosphate guanylyltransferase/mannose-6-phosphate isomerase [Pseudomonadota bacterium]
MITPVILCNGDDRGLWPSSRPTYPKQFVELSKEENLLGATLRRFKNPGFSAPILATNEVSRFLVEEQVHALGLLDAQIFVEPCQRGTAAAILTASLNLEGNSNALILITQSDHMFSNAKAFHQAVQIGTRAAKDGALVVFGMPPTCPEVTFDYLELSDAPDAYQATKVVGFTQKPTAEQAAKILAGENCLWNTGMFLARVGDLIKVFETFAPDLFKSCREALEGGTRELGFVNLAQGAFEAASDISIEEAIFAKADNIVAVPYRAEWSDLGNWRSSRTALAKDSNGVTKLGAVTAADCQNTLLLSEEENIRLVGVGLRNIAAIATRDAILVADLDHAENVEGVVDTLRRDAVPQAHDYSRFHRPWGWYETLCLADRFQVKRIMVKPGGILSLQSHVHRSEHWVVVSGTARVTIGDEVRLMSENESVFVPLGAVHRLENPGKVPMYLIEVQLGTYLGEDDIVRYEDVYNRD